MAKASILGVQTDAQGFDQAIHQLQQWAIDSKGRYVCTCPVYTLMMCRENPSVMQAVNGAAMVTADQSLEYQQNLKGRKLAHIVLSSNHIQVLQAQPEKLVAAVDSAFAGSYEFVRFELPPKPWNERVGP